MGEPCLLPRLRESPLTNSPSSPHSIKNLQHESLGTSGGPPTSFLKTYLVTLFDPTNFLLGLLVLGLLFTGWGVRAFWVYFSDPMTTPVSGTVLVAKSVTINRNSPSSRVRTAYHFRYQYEYQDETYTAKRFSYKTEGQAAAVRRFRPGDRIAVYIDPQNPERAIVDKGLSWLNVIWVLAGVVISGGVLVMHGSMLRDRFKV